MQILRNFFRNIFRRPSNQRIDSADLENDAAASDLSSGSCRIAGEPDMAIFSCSNSITYLFRVMTIHKKRRGHCAMYSLEGPLKPMSIYKAQEAHARNARYIHKDSTLCCRTVGRQLAEHPCAFARYLLDLAVLQGGKATIRPFQRIVTQK